MIYKARMGPLQGTPLEVGDTVVLLDELSPAIVECRVSSIFADVTATVASVRASDGGELPSYVLRMVGEEITFQRNFIQEIKSDRPIAKFVKHTAQGILATVVMIALAMCVAQPLDESCRPGPVQRGADICG